MRLRTVLGTLALGGCAALPPLTDQVDVAVRDAAQAVRASPAEQKSVLTGAQAAFVSESTAVNRLRLATLLASLPPPLRDDVRAAELLDPLVEAGGTATGRFAAVLAAQIAERQRLAREIDRLLKERAAAERERQAADKERDKREEALRQQLEALRAIERGILDREERLRRNPGAKP